MVSALLVRLLSVTSSQFGMPHMITISASQNYRQYEHRHGMAQCDNVRVGFQVCNLEQGFVLRP